MWLSSQKQHGGSAWGLCLAAAFCVLLPATALSQMLATPDQVLVVSVGTRKRAELQETQKQTFAKHLETWYYDEVDILLHIAALSAIQQLLVMAVVLVGSCWLHSGVSHSLSLLAEECTASLTSCLSAGCGAMHLCVPSSKAAAPI